MMTFNEAIKKLDYPRKKDSKKLENNTYLIRLDKDRIGIRLHQTEVVVLHPDHCELFSGGWRTATTKDRINKYSPVHLYQENSVWYLNNADTIFYEGIKVDYKGKLLSKPRDDKKIIAHNKKMLKKINTYVEGFIEALKLGLPRPSGGDCWFCAMQDEQGKTLGDLSSTEHLINHMEEKYYVPSLVLNAVKEDGYKDPAFIIGYNQVTDKIGGHDIFAQNARLSLKKYLKRRLYIK